MKNAEPKTTLFDSHNLLFAAVLVTTLFVGTSVAQPKVDPRQVAKKMVGALTSVDVSIFASVFYGSSLPPNEKAFVAGWLPKALEAAAATTGSSPDGETSVAYNAWLLTRHTRGADAMEQYVARLRLIDLATVDAWDAWQRRLGKSDMAGNSRLRTLGAIAAQDFLFDGKNWKRGNPSAALARLKFLPMEAAARWQKASKSSSFGSQENPLAAWALPDVDELFSNDTFQQAVFDAALPIAEDLARTR